MLFESIDGDSHPFGGSSNLPRPVWTRAKTVSLDRPYDFCEIRFDNESDTPLCRSGGVVVTVLYVRWETFEVL